MGTYPARGGPPELSRGFGREPPGQSPEFQRKRLVLFRRENQRTTSATFTRDGRLLRISWFAARTFFAQEERAEQNLRNQDYQTLLPLAKIETRRRDGLLVDRTRALFTGYIFVGVEDDRRWQPIANTFGVRGFVGYVAGAKRPPVVDMRDIEELKRRITDAGGFFKLGLSRPQEIRPGMLVRILFGPFRDRPALVEADRGSRVQVLLQAAGAMSHLKLPKECLIAA